MKFAEDTLNNWTKPASDSEETKLSNAERLVRDGINEEPLLTNRKTRTFGQGSYANDTNVRQDSDIDINVLYEGGFYYKIPDGRTKEEFSLTNPHNYEFPELKNAVHTALVKKFGMDAVRDDKCITVAANSGRIVTDVVPTFRYRRYWDDGTFTSGVKFLTDSQKWIVNFPEQHLKNGIQKNADTSKRFKRLTRIFRKIRYKMIDDGVTVSDNITSFLLECLVWNVPNPVFNDYLYWHERLRHAILHLFNETKDEEQCHKMKEVSGCLWLFSDRKWNCRDVNDYMRQMWAYLEFDK